VELERLNRSLTCAALFVIMTVNTLPAVAQPVGVTNGYLEGRWKDNALCLGKTQFAFDVSGSVMVAEANLIGYSVSGANQVVLSGAGGQYVITTSPVDEDTMYFSDNRGTAGNLYRCSPTPQIAKNMYYTPQGGQQAVAVTPSYLLGRWTDVNNCSVTSTFYPNGTVVGNTGQSTNWSLAGNQLTFFANNVATVLSVWGIDQNTMRTVDANGQQSLSRRCP
jgi:hypothetical protein